MDIEKLKKLNLSLTYNINLELLIIWDETNKELILDKKTSKTEFFKILNEIMKEKKETQYNNKKYMNFENIKIEIH